MLVLMRSESTPKLGLNGLKLLAAWTKAHSGTKCGELRSSRCTRRNPSEVECIWCIRRRRKFRRKKSMLQIENFSVREVG